MERLEQTLLENGDENELMSKPLTMTLLDDNFTLKGVKGGASKGRKGKPISQNHNNMKRAIRDPDLPKRPTNAYLMFCDQEKERIQTVMATTRSGHLSQDFTKVLTDAWNCLSDEQKRPYQKLYEDDRERYQREMVEYNQRKFGEEDNVDDAPLNCDESSHANLSVDNIMNENVKRAKIDKPDASSTFHEVEVGDARQVTPLQ